MELYFGKISGNSLRAAFGLYEAGATFVPRVLDTASGANRAAAYLALNPMGKIPALVDGAMQLWESNAITWYAAEKHPAARLIPASIEERASMQRWLFFQAGHVSPACVGFFRAMHPRVREHWRVAVDPAVVDQARKELARFLPVVEGALAGREWLQAEFSLADVALAPHLWLIADAGYDFGPTPAVRAWLDRVLARPAWRKARELVFG